MKINKNYSGSLDLQGTQITALPDGLTVGGSLYLQGTQITGSVANCGSQKRTILAWNDKIDGPVISLGCFRGSESAAIEAIKNKYSGAECVEYIAKVILAFDRLRK